MPSHMPIHAQPAQPRRMRRKPAPHLLLRGKLGHPHVHLSLEGQRCLLGLSKRQLIRSRMHRACALVLARPGQPLLYHLLVQPLLRMRETDATCFGKGRLGAHVPRMQEAQVLGAGARQGGQQ